MMNFTYGFRVVTIFRNINKPILNVRIIETDECHFDNNEWKNIRPLNVNQTPQGRFNPIFLKDYKIQSFERYNYE